MSDSSVALMLWSHCLRGTPTLTVLALTPESTRNVLLRDQDDLSSVVLIDFGLSRFLPEDTASLQPTAESCADEEQRRTIQAMACTPRCGTVQYMSPEMLTVNCSNASSPAGDMMAMSVSDMQATDVWSLGVVLYVSRMTSNFIKPSKNLFASGHLVGQFDVRLIYANNRCC